MLFGISTSGITLSTVRRAADLDYQCTILKDACYDADPEVHRVLTEKIFPIQATVLTVEAFMLAGNRGDVTPEGRLRDSPRHTIRRARRSR